MALQYLPLCDGEGGRTMRLGIASNPQCR